MQCAWDMFLRLLPGKYRELTDKLGRASLNEVRLRLGMPAELVFGSSRKKIEPSVTVEDLQQCINFASQHSPWSAVTLDHGYITAAGGHRIGVFGRYGHRHNGGWSLQTPSMLCLRVARDYAGIAQNAKASPGSILIIGPPGCGKTTFLRDLIRQHSMRIDGNISVIDEREEIFPRSSCGLYFTPGPKTDILSGCSKAEGINWALRNMTPSIIAVDEITQAEDCDALLHAGWCGVRLLATAHAGSSDDLYARPVYREILNHHLFQTMIVMRRDKSWTVERIGI